jgi:hypothetical protein
MSKFDGEKVIAYRVRRRRHGGRRDRGRRAPANAGGAKDSESPL